MSGTSATTTPRLLVLMLSPMLKILVLMQWTLVLLLGVLVPIPHCYSAKAFGLVLGHGSNTEAFGSNAETFNSNAQVVGSSNEAFGSYAEGFDSNTESHGSNAKAFGFKGRGFWF